MLAEVQSAPFDSLAMMVNRRSLNIGAEALLRWGADGAADAPARLTRFVEEVVGPEARVKLLDGCGLSPADRVSPLTQALYLARVPRRPGLQSFATLLPLNGTGTLRHFRRGVLPAGVMRAKTGTLDSVSALTGYLGRRDGVLVISAITTGPAPARPSGSSGTSSGCWGRAGWTSPPPRPTTRPSSGATTRGIGANLGS